MEKVYTAKNLTQYDNVCIAARDVNGDGKVEIAVGAQWNPSETSDPAISGSVHYLVRPADPTQLWTALPLYHEPTIHRMKWLKSSAGKFYLVVVPLHGRGNVHGEGKGANILAYEFPKNVTEKWRVDTLYNKMHLTHNFDILESNDKSTSGFYLAGKEGVRYVDGDIHEEPKELIGKADGLTAGAGEIRAGRVTPDKNFIVTVEPMHGDKLVVYLMANNTKRIVIDDDLKEGHALAVADFFGTGAPQIVAGWRLPNKDRLTGIKLYIKKDAPGDQWESQWVDKNGIACEDIQVMDLNQDGKPDIVASGRATHNIKIYWNKIK